MEKQQILETITAVSRLITLSFLKKGTKVAIRNHNIVLCEPTQKSYFGLNITQGIDRYINGDSRDDIYNLNHVICNFINWYIIPYKKNDNDIYKGLINMTKYLCVGLKRLQITYKSGNVVGTLQYYINVLLSVINSTFHPDMLYTNNTSEKMSFLDDDGVDNIEFSTIFDIDKIKNFWSKKELSALFNQFDSCFKMPDDPDYDIFYDETSEDGFGTKQNSTPEVSSPKTPRSVKDISHKASTPKLSSTPTEYDRKSMTSNKSATSYVPLPIPRSLNNAIVQGNLVGISKMLSVMDKKFTDMLEQSVKGC